MTWHQNHLQTQKCDYSTTCLVRTGGKQTTNTAAAFIMQLIPWNTIYNKAFIHQTFKMRIATPTFLHIKCLLLHTILSKIRKCKILSKLHNIKFHEYLFSRSKDTDRQADKVKLTSIADVPNRWSTVLTVVLMLLKLCRCTRVDKLPSSTPSNSTTAPVIFVPQLFKSTATGLLLMTAKWASFWLALPTVPKFISVSLNPEKITCNHTYKQYFLAHL